MIPVSPRPKLLLLKLAVRTAARTVTAIAKNAKNAKTVTGAVTRTVGLVATRAVDVTPAWAVDVTPTWAVDVAPTWAWVWAMGVACAAAEPIEHLKIPKRTFSRQDEEIEQLIDRLSSRAGVPTCSARVRAFLLLSGNRCGERRKPSVRIQVEGNDLVLTRILLNSRAIKKSRRVIYHAMSSSITPLLRIIRPT